MSSVSKRKLTVDEIWAWAICLGLAIGLPYAVLGGYFSLMMSGIAAGELDVMAFITVFIPCLLLISVLAVGVIGVRIARFWKKHDTELGRGELSRFGLQASWIVPGIITVLLAVPTVSRTPTILVVGAFVVLVTMLFAAGVSFLFFWILKRKWQNENG